MVGFVLNAREAQWWKRTVTVSDFEGEPRFRQLGINLTLLEPGEPMTMYHWEADEEDFLILSGEAVVVIEGARTRLVAGGDSHTRLTLRSQQRVVRRARPPTSETSGSAR